MAQTIASESLTRSLIGRMGWALAGTVAAQGSVFLIAIVNARLLGRLDFGRLAILQTGASMVTSLASAGLGITATKFVAQLSGQDPRRVGRILGLCSAVTALTGILFGGAFLVAAPWVAMMFNIVGMEAQIRLICVQVFFLTLNAYQVGAMGGFSAFDRLARIGAIQGFVSIALTAAGTWIFGLTGTVIAFGISAATSWVQHQIALREVCAKHGIEVAYRHVLTEVGVLWRFELPAALCGWVGAMAVTAGSTLIVRQADGAQALAIFNAANTIRIVVLFVPGLVGKVSTPVLCKLTDPENAVAYRRALGRFLGLTAALAAAAAGLLAFAGPWLLWLFGKDFMGGGQILNVLMMAAVLEAISMSLFATLLSHGRMWLGLLVLSTWAVTLVGVTRALAPDKGALALSMGYFASWTVAAVLYSIVVFGILLTRRTKNLELVRTE